MLYLRRYRDGTLHQVTVDPHGVIRHVARRSIDREFEDLAVARVSAVRAAAGPKGAKEASAEDGATFARA